ncbi:MAG TPA: hypothetical protein DCY20_02065 [Firmicutes bacterium]|nr:hypothetical protein [Bacillota bacterium]
MNQDSLSCTNCQTYHCRFLNGGNFPKFCKTSETAQAVIDETVALYTEDASVSRISEAALAAEIEYRGRLTRVEETIVFAQKMGAKKVGIATCIGLIEEAKIFARILESHGLEAVGISCKVGAVDKTALNILDEQKQNPGCHESICNPILQAKLLSQEQTDLNVIIGLCVGHDTLFMQHSQAPMTTLVVKDRVLAHNPVGALYTSHSFYKKIKAK